MRAMLLFLAYRPPGTTAGTIPRTDQGVAGRKLKHTSKGKCPPRSSFPRMRFRFQRRSLAINDLAGSFSRCFLNHLVIQSSFKDPDLSIVDNLCQAFQFFCAVDSLSRAPRAIITSMSTTISSCPSRDQKDRPSMPNQVYDIDRFHHTVSAGSSGSRSYNFYEKRSGSTGVDVR